MPIPPSRKKGEGKDDGTKDGSCSFSAAKKLIDERTAEERTLKWTEETAETAE